MVVEIVQPNRTFKVIRILAYLIVFTSLADLIIPNLNYPAIVYKILFVVILAVATLKFFIKSFDIIGEFECFHGSFRLVMSGIKKECDINTIDRMKVVILAYTGKPIGLAIRTHHGADNRIDIVIEGEKYSFFFRLDDRQALNVFETRMHEWASINKNIDIRKSVI